MKLNLPYALSTSPWERAWGEVRLIEVIEKTVYYSHYYSKYRRTLI
jgi:hypothetical protein